MKKGLFILLPVIAFAVFMSRDHTSAMPAGIPATAGQVLPAATSTLASPAPIAEPGVSVLPTKVIQGDPILIQVTGTTSVRSIVFNKSLLPVFTQGGMPAALAPVDLRQAVGTYPVTVTLTDGQVMKKNVIVAARVMPSAPLGIPDSLGGNTPQAEQELVSTLVEEAKIINAIPVTDARLWSTPFAWPLTGQLTVTDPYGYSRETGGSTLAHKGTDFRAATGTPVYAVNDGKVAYVGYLRNYGNVIAVDHGARVLSIYMHLSRVDKKVGDTVRKGEQLALSGNTGYVLGPHLHLTIRIAGISVDPMVFMSLLGEK